MLYHGTHIDVIRNYIATRFRGAAVEVEPSNVDKIVGLISVTPLNMETGERILKAVLNSMWGVPLQ